MYYSFCIDMAWNSAEQCWRIIYFDAKEMEDAQTPRVAFGINDIPSPGILYSLGSYLPVDSSLGRALRMAWKEKTKDDGLVAEIVSLDVSCPFCRLQERAVINDRFSKLNARVETLDANQEDLKSLANSRCSGCASNALIELIVRALTILLSVANLRDPHLRKELDTYLEELKRACDGFDRWGSDYVP